MLMALTTLSFLTTTPEAWVPALGDANHGFPYLSGVGRLMIKDSIMLGAAFLTDDRCGKRSSAQTQPLNHLMHGTGVIISTVVCITEPEWDDRPSVLTTNPETVPLEESWPQRPRENFRNHGTPCDRTGKWFSRVLSLSHCLK